MILTYNIGNVQQIKKIRTIATLQRLNSNKAGNFNNEL